MWRLRSSPERLWTAGRPPPGRPFPALKVVLAALLAALAALYPAPALHARLLFAFLGGLFAGSVLVGLRWRCPRCHALVLVPASRFCGRCGSPLA